MTQTTKYGGCSHGISFDAPCVECRKITVIALIKDYEDQLSRLKKELGVLMNAYEEVKT